MLKIKYLYILMILFLVSSFVGCSGPDVINSETNIEEDSEANLEGNSEGNTETNTEVNTEISTEDKVDTETKNDTELNTESNTEINTEEFQPQEHEYTYQEVTGKKYSAVALNVRHKPSADGDKMGMLSMYQEVIITGICNETGWYRIKYGNTFGYVSPDYLLEELPSSWVKELDIAQTVSQIIVVTAKDMESTDVTVSMHTKEANGLWTENYSTNGKIGRNGLGKQKEGDGKTPIGIYSFNKAFGIMPNPGITVMPYLKVDETHHWVDDPESKYYNQCVSTRDVEQTWNSSEHLYKYIGDYNYALSTTYNEDCVPYAGCAIFLHCPVKNGRPTSGCIAIPEVYMIQTMTLLKEDCVIVIDTVEDIMNY